MAMQQSLNEASTSCSKEDSDELILLKELFTFLFTIPPVINGNVDVIEKINDIQDKIIKNGEIDLESQKSLTSCYETSEKQTDEEEVIIKKALDIIYEIRNIRQKKMKKLMPYQRNSTFLKLLQLNATTIPVWFPINNEKPPPLCGAIPPLPSYVAKSGDLVVALVKQSGEERWIVAEAVTFKNGLYDVEDIDIKEINRNFTVKKKYVKPLPLMRADPIICPEALFPRNTSVLAKYPQTTCFFKALVKAQPKTSRDGYEILFEDDFNNYTIMMIVPQRFVVSAMNE